MARGGERSFNIEKAALVFENLLGHTNDQSITMNSDSRSSSNPKEKRKQVVSPQILCIAMVDGK